MWANSSITAKNHSGAFNSDWLVIIYFIMKLQYFLTSTPAPQSDWISTENVSPPCMQNIRERKTTHFNALVKNVVNTERAT